MRSIKIRVVITLVLTVLIFNSCKNEDSKKLTTETNEMEKEDPISVENENAKFLDKIENYIIKDYLTERDLRTISNDQRKFQLHQIDLNGDGNNEIFINFVTFYFCGSGGCTVLLLSDKMEPITEFTVTRTPIYIEESVEDGWRVLMVQSDGKWRKQIYKNGSYSSNPSVAEVSKDPPSENAIVIFDVNNDNLKTYSF